MQSSESIAAKIRTLLMVPEHSSQGVELVRALGDAAVYQALFREVDIRTKPMLEFVSVKDREPAELDCVTWLSLLASGEDLFGKDVRDEVTSIALVSRSPKQAPRPVDLRSFEAFARIERLAFVGPYDLQETSVLRALPHLDHLEFKNIIGEAFSRPGPQIRTGTLTFQSCRPKILAERFRPTRQVTILDTELDTLNFEGLDCLRIDGKSAPLLGTIQHPIREVRLSEIRIQDLRVLKEIPGLKRLTTAWIILEGKPLSQGLVQTPTNALWAELGIPVWLKGKLEVTRGEF